MKRVRVKEFVYPKVFIAEKRNGAPVFEIDDRYAGETRPIFALLLITAILLGLAAPPSLAITVPLLVLVGWRRPLRLSFDAGKGEARGIQQKPLPLESIGAFTVEPHPKSASHQTGRWRGVCCVNAYYGPLGANRAHIAQFTARGAQTEAPAQIRAACQWCHEQALRASPRQARERV